MSTIPGIVGNNMANELRTRNSQSSSDTQAQKTSTAANNVASSSDSSSGSDVQLSEASKLASRVQNELDSFPVVDENRVAQLKAQIASGQYYPDSQKIAGKMVMLENLMSRSDAE